MFAPLIWAVSWNWASWVNPLCPCSHYRFSPLPRCMCLKAHLVLSIPRVESAFNWWPSMIVTCREEQKVSGIMVLSITYTHLYTITKVVLEKCYLEKSEGDRRHLVSCWLNNSANKEKFVLKQLKWKGKDRRQTARSTLEIREKFKRKINQSSTKPSLACKFNYTGLHTFTVIKVRTILGCIWEAEFKNGIGFAQFALVWGVLHSHFTCLIK